MKLSAPSTAIFLISTIVIAVVVAAQYFGVDIPVLTAIALGHPFEATLLAWFLLFIGVAFNL